MQSLRSVRDEDLLRELPELVKKGRGVDAEVVARIGEVELRRLYAQEAHTTPTWPSSTMGKK